MGEFVRVETSSGVATIRIDRPKMNAINPQMLAELTEAANTIAADGDVRAAVVWGGPRIFAAGADIGGFTGLDAAEAQALSRVFNDAFLAVENMPQITVSAVNGYALGGGMELAMATDFRVAADDATFGQPEILLGIIPGGGGTQRLPRLVGVTRAKEIIYTGRNVHPDEALAIGLVSAVHPPEETYDAAVEMAAGYAAGPARAAHGEAGGHGRLGPVTNRRGGPRDRAVRRLLRHRGRLHRRGQLPGEGPRQGHLYRPLAHISKLMPEMCLKRPNPHQFRRRAAA